MYKYPSSIYSVEVSAEIICRINSRHLTKEMMEELEEKFTHVVLSEGPIEYVSFGNEPRLLANVCEKVADGEVFAWAELPRDKMPVVFDFDLLYPLNIIHRVTKPGWKIDVVYRKEDVKATIAVIRRVLTETTNISDKKALICCVLEKTESRQEVGVIRSGFHLHFPFAI